MLDVNEACTLTITGDVATIMLDSPPVNALSAKVREGILAGIEQAVANATVRGIILACAGRTFFAGADIGELGKPFVQPDLRAVLAVVEGSPKPIVAAIHGTALGGGLEVALACHYRVAVASAKVGLPEVALGLLPGAGGTQRLPRIVGPSAALDMMVFGRPVGAEKAMALGLIDEIVAEGRLREGTADFLAKVLLENRPLQRVRDRADALDEAKQNPALFDDFRKVHARAFRGFKAPENVVRAIEAAVSLPFDQGMAREGELFLELLHSPESAAQRYVFFAERQVAKIPDVPASTSVLPIATVAVIGAGTMGGGIAMNFLNVGVPVTLVEQTQQALDRGVAAIRGNYEITAKKGRLRPEEMDRRLALLTPTLDMNAISGADLVIEAVFEDLDVKKRVFALLDGIAAPRAVLASNTSFLDLDAIAAATSRPEQVIGLHFFSPANVMRLLEVVRGAGTSDQVIATGMALGRKIGKIAILSRVHEGFIANRAMKPRSALANDLILRGPMPWDVDRAMLAFGFPMGPFAMLDLVGLDVIDWDASTSSSSTVLEILCEQGRWGQKRGAGFYDYDENRRASPSPVTQGIITQFSERLGAAREPSSDRDIVEQLLAAVVNEGTRILEDGVAIRASDIDMALVNGYAWPVYTGGPMFWADGIGLDRVIDRLDHLATQHGSTYAPSALLLATAKEGGKIHEIGR